MHLAIKSDKKTQERVQKATGQCSHSCMRKDAAQKAFSTTGSLRSVRNLAK